MTDRNRVVAQLRAALQNVKTPAGTDIVASGHVQNVEFDDDGVVKFQFQLKPEDPGTLVREARSAAEAVDGVTKVKIDVRLPNAPQQGKSRQMQPGSVPAPTPDPSLVAGIAHVVAVSSGKGGVGKSTVAANLAAALARSGYRGPARRRRVRPEHPADVRGEAQAAGDGRAGFGEDRAAGGARREADVARLPARGRAAGHHARDRSCRAS
jgi:metal-sulfur cluster biosynthetic enzyme